MSRGRNITVVTGVIAVLALCGFVYPSLIFRLYGQMPPEWSRMADRHDIGQMRQGLGPPYYEESAKSTLQWRRSYWWGYKQLQLLAADINQPANAPDAVSYTVHVNGYGRFSDVYSAVVDGAGTWRVRLAYPLIAAAR